jgi:phospholipid/cholesterol/gamma-HCH transport system substrate-binding protein
VARFKTRLMGLGMLVVIAALIALSIGMYNKNLPFFYKTTAVSLQVDRVGHQLVVPADVKMRGVLIGTVTGVRDNGSYATMTLKLNPDQAKLVPANVKATILPKTLFGEKFVELTPPTGTGTGFPAIKAGAVISQDRSSTAIEAESVFNDLVPLLKALSPVQLNLTLTALSQALSGRGNQLGDQLARTDSYLTSFNTRLGTLDADISGIADLATNLNVATPDLLATARNLVTTSNTLVCTATHSDCPAGSGNAGNGKSGNLLDSFLIGVKSGVATANQVLGQNSDAIAKLTTISQPTLQLLAQYSPEFPCMLGGLSRQEVVLDRAFGYDDTANGGKGARVDSTGLHITLRLVGQPHGYVAGQDDPSYATLPLDLGPNCYGSLPYSPTKPQLPQGGFPGLEDPTSLLPPTAGSAGPPAGSPLPANSRSVSAQATDMAKIITAPTLGIDSDKVPDIVSFLVAPQLVGKEVAVQ